MKAVIGSSKFQVVIPREIRESTELQPGTKMQIFDYENRIELSPLKNLKALRGSIKGINTGVNRAEDLPQPDLNLKEIK